MIFDQFRNLTGSIGRTGRNDAAEVAGIEAALGSQGYLDLGKTDGATGYFGTRMEDAIKGFQKDNGLKVDGVISPGGETFAQLSKKGRAGADIADTAKGAPARQTDAAERARRAGA